MSLFKGIRYFLLSDNNKQKTIREVLGFYPKNMHLYEQAFTHKSIVNEHNQEENKVSNERLEFLGDAILGSIVAEYFFKKYPHQDEGFLTKMRSRLVSRNFLNQLSVDIGLDTFLETSADTSRTKSIFGDAFEALIGAIYLDRGYAFCKKFVLEKVIKDYVNIEQLVEEERDYKSKLVEYCQKNKIDFSFQAKEKENETSKFYEVSLFVNDKLVGTASDKSKKKAEQTAAKAYFTHS